MGVLCVRLIFQAALVLWIKCLVPVLRHSRGKDGPLMGICTRLSNGLQSAFSRGDLVIMLDLYLHEITKSAF